MMRFGWGDYAGLLCGHDRSHKYLGTYVRVYCSRNLVSLSLETLDSSLETLGSSLGSSLIYGSWSVRAILTPLPPPH